MQGGAADQKRTEREGGITKAADKGSSTLCDSRVTARGSD